MSDNYRHHTVMSWVLSLLRLNIKCMSLKVIIAVLRPLTKASGGIDTLIVSMPTEDALMY
jgi:hypothetical protein